MFFLVFSTMGIFLNKVTDQRQMLALTGLSTEEFKELLTSFTTIYKKSRELILQDRLLQTDLSGGGIRSDDGDRLFFVLFYMKTYPTFDVLSYQFGCCRGTAWNNVTKKNTIIANADKEVIYLGNTVFGGSHHDFGLLKKEFKGKETWFENQNVHIDLGYLGFDGVFKTKTTHIPHKKAKKSKKIQHLRLQKNKINKKQSKECL